MDALSKDARLTVHKSFEKALADFCVYRPGAHDLALGIQLKTTGVFWTQAKTGNKYFSFCDTDGYSGLLIIFVALHTHPPRIWFAEGSQVHSKCVQIPVVSQRPRKTNRVKEVTFEELSGAIENTLESALRGKTTYVIRPHTDHEKPTEQNVLAEYKAFKFLQLQLPVNFIDPPTEHMAFDCLVETKKWQLKLARYSEPRDAYCVNCFKNAGRIQGKPTKVQYEVGDFDFVCIQLPEDTIHKCCYLIPQRELQNRGLLGDATKCNGNVSVYPHRLLVSTKKVHSEGVHWTELYRVDFDDKVASKLQQIQLA